MLKKGICGIREKKMQPECRIWADTELAATASGARKREKFRIFVFMWSVCVIVDDMIWCSVSRLAVRWAQIVNKQTVSHTHGHGHEHADTILSPKRKTNKLKMEQNRLRKKRKKYGCELLETATWHFSARFFSYTVSSLWHIAFSQLRIYIFFCCFVFAFIYFVVFRIFFFSSLILCGKW